MFGPSPACMAPLGLAAAASRRHAITMHICFNQLVFNSVQLSSSSTRLLCAAGPARGVFHGVGGGI